jgi:signal transduction histidine kinase
MPRIWRPSGRSRSWSLRAQLLLTLLISVVLFATAASLLTARAYRQDRATAGRQLARLAESAAARLDSQMAQSQQLLAGIAAQDAIAALDEKGCGLVLSGFRGLGPGYLALVRADGRVLCSSRPPGESFPAGGFATAGWLADTVRTGTAVHAEPVSDPVTGHPSLVMATPVAGTRPGAVLAAVLDLESFATDLVGPLEEDRGTVVGALDAAGTTVLFRHPGRYSGRAVNGDQVGSSLHEAKGLDGVQRVFRSVKAPELGWQVYAGTPVSMAFAPARRTVSQSILLTLVVVCMLAVMTLLLSHRLLRPARTLTTAIVAARSGTRGAVAPEDGPAEFARMAAEFNALQVARAAEETRRKAADASLADRMAELAAMRAELQRALVRFTEGQEDERRRIAHTVHDETIQALIATMWALDDLDSEAGSAAADVLERVRGNLAGAVNSARQLLFDLRPPALDELGLSAAIEQQLQRLAAEDGLAVEFESNCTGRFSTHVETLAFRTAQEALRNVHQHAGATAAWVTVHRTDDHLEIGVEDDGIGVRQEHLVAGGPSRAGIVAMREAIAMCGGRFAIGPRSPRGTRLSFSVPLEEEPAV